MRGKDREGKETDRQTEQTRETGRERGERERKE